MNSIKCPQCGLVNFASASECKRCHSPFQEPESIETTAPEPVQPYPFWPAPGAKAEVRTPDWEAFTKSVIVPVQLDPQALDDAAPFTVGMIFFVVCLLASMAFLVYQLQEYSHFMSSDAWKVLTNTRSKLYVSFMEPLTYFERYARILALIVTPILLFSFFVKSPLFLRWVRVYLVGGFIYLVIDVWGGLEVERILREKQLGPDFDPIIDILHWYVYFCVISMLVQFIWFRYFTTSERVKRTFVH